MIHYQVTDGFKWTDGEGYYSEVYAPDDAPAFTLVPDAEVPTNETEDEEISDDGALAIIMGGDGV